MTCRIGGRARFALAALLGLAPARAALAEEAPEGVRIERIHYRGTGCPEGSTFVEVSPDRQSFVVIFEDFHAEAGPDVSPSQKISQCGLNLHLSYPPGWSFTTASVAYRGSAVLGLGVVARLDARLNMPGHPSSGAEQVLEGTGTGPQDFDLIQRVDDGRWSPCSRRGTLPVNIVAKAEVDNSADRSKIGVISVAQEDGVFDVAFNVRWRRCS